MTDSITNLPAAVAAPGALPVPVGTVEPSRLSPQREAETFASMDDRGGPEPSDAEEKRARLFGFVESGANEGDLPTFAAALNDYVAAELAAVRAERDELAERVETVRALCDAADAAGITAGGWFSVENVRKAITVQAGESS